MRDEVERVEALAVGEGRVGPVRDEQVHHVQVAVADVVGAEVGGRADERRQSWEEKEVREGRGREDGPRGPLEGRGDELAAERVDVGAPVEQEPARAELSRRRGRGGGASA